MTRDLASLAVGLPLARRTDPPRREVEAAIARWERAGGVQ